MAKSERGSVLRHVVACWTCQRHPFGPLFGPLSARRAIATGTTSKFQNPSVQAIFQAMSSFQGGDSLGTVVVDVGSAATKIGYAGDDFPVSYFRSVCIDISILQARTI